MFDLKQRNEELSQVLNQGAVMLPHQALTEPRSAILYPQVAMLTCALKQAPPASKKLILSPETTA